MRETITDAEQLRNDFNTSSATFTGSTFSFVLNTDRLLRYLWFGLNFY